MKFIHINGEPNTLYNLANGRTIPKHKIRNGKICLKSAKVPFTFYCVKDVSFAMTMAGGSKQTVSLTDGNYSITSLCSAVKAGLETASALSGTSETFTLTPSATTKHITITTTTSPGTSTAFTLHFDETNLIAYMLGFTNTILTGTNTYVGTKIYNPYPYENIFVSFSTWSIPTFISSTNSANNSAHLIIPMDTLAYSTYLLYNENTNYRVELDVSGIDEITDFKFDVWTIDSNGSRVNLDFNGQKLNFIFGYES